MKNSPSKTIFPKILLILIFLSLTMPLFAASNIESALNPVMTTLLDIFTGRIVKVVLIMCLCGCAVAYAFNKDNEKMKRNIIAIAIGLVVLIFAETIIDMIWNTKT